MDFSSLRKKPNLIPWRSSWRKAEKSDCKMQNEIVHIHLELGSLLQNINKKTKKGKNQEGEVTRKGTGLLTVKIHEPGWGKTFTI